jgi:hypothetical protein
MHYDRRFIILLDESHQQIIQIDEIVILQIFDILKSRLNAWMSDSILVDKHFIQVHINFIEIVERTRLFIFKILIL